MGRGLLPRPDVIRHRTGHHCPWEAGPGHQRVRKQADQATEQLRGVSLEDGEERLLNLSHADSSTPAQLTNKSLAYLYLKVRVGFKPIQARAFYIQTRAATFEQ